ncbi:MAG TPA: hypothetical protein IGR64_17550 [Leptolyngbyaceae cyanobacterium M65_K2018_010]|nr:hypothetical protein [Leptolyngbyaceae cyanobacterium M65_K2018_010]
MTPLFKKLNLKDQTDILVLNAPPSFEPELAALEGVRVHRDGQALAAITFALAFVTTQAAVDELARVIAAKVQGDGVVWFAYSKTSSKRFTCDFNRDTGWQILGELGYEGVRQVAIDTDRSALRFRRVDYIKNLTRDPKRAMTKAGKERVTPAATVPPNP